jgi:hypothetical protein
MLVKDIFWVEGLPLIILLLFFCCGSTSKQTPVGDEDLSLNVFLNFLTMLILLGFPLFGFIIHRIFPRRDHFEQI